MVADKEMLGFLDRPVGRSEPWRCGGCKRLMYNLDAAGYPTAGAPLPMYLDEEYPSVCTLCYQMYMALLTENKAYWKPERSRPMRPDQWSDYS